MTVVITAQTLERTQSGERACGPARQWFAAAFPNGGELAEVWDACPRWQWRVWFAAHSAKLGEAMAFARDCVRRAEDYAVAVAEAADHYYAAASFVSGAANHVVTAYANFAAAAANATFNAAEVAGAADDEIRIQVAWARRILFGEST